MPKFIRSLSSTIDEGIMSSFGDVVFRKETVLEKDRTDPLTTRIQRVIKRGMDIFFSIVLLVVSLPLFILISATIKIFTGGAVFFRQERVGFRGKTFTIWKFSTMRPDHSEDDHRAYIRELLDEGNESGENVQLISKYIDYVDSRTTKIGRFLRATSLDELPQLFNILKGNMSLVGPRPHPVYEVDEYKEWYRRRLSVKPGLTGWSKINLRLTPKNYEESILYDLWYVDNWNVWLDVRIVLMTVPFILSSKEAR